MLKLLSSGSSLFLYILILDLATWVALAKEISANRTQEKAWKVLGYLCVISRFHP